jgi:hypothetical protein
MPRAHYYATHYAQTWRIIMAHAHVHTYGTRTCAHNACAHTITAHVAQRGTYAHIMLMPHDATRDPHMGAHKQQSLVSSDYYATCHLPTRRYLNAWHMPHMPLGTWHMSIVDGAHGTWHMRTSC